MFLRQQNMFVRSFLLAVLILSNVSCSDRDLTPVQLELSRSVSKLPFLIAYDQGFFEEHGLDVEIRLEPPEFEHAVKAPSDGIFARIWQKLRALRGFTWKPDIRISGANGRIFDMTTSAAEPRRLFIAATDCVVSEYIIGRKGIERIDELKGKRLGVSSTRGNSAYVALLLAERMQWDPVHDISIMQRGNNIQALTDGRVDAIVASDREYSMALQKGLPVLLETSAWEEPLAGNSVYVSPEWLQDSTNRETARRFLKASVAGIAAYKQDRELALEILRKWHGISDRTYAERIYEHGKSMPRKPYPCYEGIRKTMQRYDSNEMRKFVPEDFYDDSLIRELDESGFIDSLYRNIESES
jgi:ABC-type nitrate/sulfonate/bicarbonate transport system substrate-binding protein